MKEERVAFTGKTGEKGQFRRCMRAEFQKYKHSPLLYVHLFFPVLGALLFAGYYHISNWSTITKISAYLEILAVAFPFLIGIIVGMVVQTEKQAGNFQVLLGSTPSRGAVYMGKLCFLLVGAILGIILTLCIFSILFREEQAILYVKAGCRLSITVIPLYLIHLFVGLHFGKGASLGLGIVGSLLAALMITGLGDKVWHYVPWAWGVRSMDYIVLAWYQPDWYAQIAHDYVAGMRWAIFCTCALLVASFLWFQRWEGGKSND